MTLADRADAYRAAFPDRPASWLVVVEERGGPCLYGRWVLGADYRNRTTFYGTFPPGLLDRMMALFPDVPIAPTARSRVLHAFAGALPPGPYVRLDVVRDADRQPDVQGDVLDVARLFGTRTFDLVVADPPYSREDATYYATPMVARRKVTAALAEVTRPGGFLCWVDCVWPMFRKTEWRTIGRIAITRSTNHRLRDLTIFERVA
jgi:hypothetical protein